MGHKTDERHYQRGARSNLHEEIPFVKTFQLNRG
jgi:hypothetical protein